MRTFHISDVLSVTTGRLVSSRHIAGTYDILNFLTGDNLYTHQLPRAMEECKPWLASQFPRLMRDHPEMRSHIDGLDAALAIAKEISADRSDLCRAWVEEVRLAESLPEMIPVFEMGAEMHTYIDPIDELRSMVGDDKVIVINPRDVSAGEN